MNEVKIRIPYADTDQMGMVYYANYFVYFERGRTEWLRERGMTYLEMETRGIFLPVVECYCEYRSPARYDDVITVRTQLDKLKFASIVFNYEILNGEKILVSGYTKHPFVNRDFRPMKIPVDFTKMFINV